ncbi:2-hydroxychromene-2-carboxylate isomerase [Streptomyces lucensis JCM 4490]|uniref:2-hydroxychromene-2-carboxylate isomerase n=1 Tax=Streptomyces lucensis JCM 4490 TaxID=1306176 RepID=A0A918MXM3_9ACTN|nr:DsbA family protein [Streptomyces lucensis]GGW82018.1 2-hydroxychromene-2-carboxylate isomerase [Streptomyces lucensis JCM 4490]
MPRVKKPPRWYFSLRSPYSWFAYLDLTQRYPEVADSLEWIPFWEPDRTTQAMLDEAGVVLPIVEMSRAKNFYILQDLARISKARGLRMTVPIDKDPNWEVSHLAYLAAKAQGLGPQFVDAVYRARWQEGRDITDPATMGEIAGQLGLPAESLATAADDPELRKQGFDCLVSSYDDGLFGVPFFVHGRDKFWGADRLRPFIAAFQGRPGEDVEENWQDHDEFPLFASAAADAGHAGGCG